MARTLAPRRPLFAAALFGTLGACGLGAAVAPARAQSVTVNFNSLNATDSTGILYVNNCYTESGFTFTAANSAGALGCSTANAFAAYATAYALAGSNVNLIAIQIGFFLSGNVMLDESFAAALVTWMVAVICVCLVLRYLLMRRVSRWLD